jgi:DNA-binding transcriptional LysR family regulator
MDKLDAMNAFAKVVALGSYAEAARVLGLTRSAVSKAVQELEHQLGVRLLDRTTRRVGPTEAGLAYYERCLDVLSRIEETELQISRLHHEPKGLLRINGPMSFGALYLGPVVADFMTAYPDLRIELTLTDRFIDPIEEGVDVTIRIAALHDSSLIARKLAPARIVMAASPDYLEQHATPVVPADLMSHRCLAYGHTSTLTKWTLQTGDELVNTPVHSLVCSNNGDVLRAAALKGHGIVFLPTFLIGPDLAAGRLRQVMAEYEPPPMGIYALYAPNRYLAVKTRVFIDFLAKRFSGIPEWDRPAQASAS